MRAGPAFLQFDWWKAALNIDLPVFVYIPIRRLASNLFQDREDTGQLFTSNDAERTLQGSYFV